MIVFGYGLIGHLFILAYIAGRYVAVTRDDLFEYGKGQKHGQGHLVDYHGNGVAAGRTGQFIGNLSKKTCSVVLISGALQQSVEFGFTVTVTHDAVKGFPQ